MAKTEKELEELKQKISKLASELEELTDEELNIMAGGVRLAGCADAKSVASNPNCKDFRIPK